MLRRQITKQVSEHGTSGQLVQDYSYDALRQLTYWRKDSGTAGEVSETYVYDTVGNRTKATYGVQFGVTGWTNNDIGRHLGAATGPNQLKEAKQYDALGTLQGSQLYFYDGNGAQTRRMHLDPFQVPQMDEAFTWSTWRGLSSTYKRTDPNMPMGMPNEWEWQYRYNAMGAREQKRQTLTPEGDDIAAEGYDWTCRLLDGSKQQLSVWKGLQTSDQTFCSTPAGSHVYLYPTEYLTYGGSSATITQKPSSSKREYRLADHLGSNRVVLDQTGTVVSTADYEPFGKPLSGSTEDRLSWIDKERDDENGYGNFGVRAYDYDMGRFTSIDPLWEKFTNWTPYHYSYNKPLTAKDPDGEETIVGPILRSIFKQIFKEAAKKEVKKKLGKQASKQVRKAAMKKAAKKALESLKKQRTSLRRGIRSKQRQVQEHKERLAAYKRNPISGDNQNFLTNAPKERVQKIISRRIRSLEHQIQEFEKQIHKDVRDLQITEDAIKIIKDLAK